MNYLLLFYGLLQLPSWRPALLCGPRLQLSGLRLRGIITFILPDWGNELTFLYTACADQAELPECPEGDLRWIPKEEVLSLPLWEGDRVFLPLLSVREDCFSLKLIYQPGGRLSEYILDGVSCRL